MLAHDPHGLGEEVVEQEGGGEERPEQGDVRLARTREERVGRAAGVVGVERRLDRALAEIATVDDDVDGVSRVRLIRSPRLRGSASRDWM